MQYEEMGWPLLRYLSDLDLPFAPADMSCQNQQF